VLNLRRRQLEMRRDPGPLPPGGRYAFGYRSMTTHGETEEVAPLAAPQSRIRIADLLPPRPAQPSSGDDTGGTDDVTPPA